MPYDPHTHHRRSIRFTGYDYTLPGGYFVTLVAHGHAHLFGEIQNGAMQANEIGKIVLQIWNEIPVHFPTVCLDQIALMPNHLHAILLIQEGNSKIQSKKRSSKPTDPNRPPKMGTSPGSLGAIIQNFKSISTRKINQSNRTPGSKIWQRNYYEHIIRNEMDLQRIREYICNNPMNWETDQENLSSKNR